MKTTPNKGGRPKMPVSEKAIKISASIRPLVLNEAKQHADRLGIPFSDYVEKAVAAKNQESCGLRVFVSSEQVEEIAERVINTIKIDPSKFIYSEPPPSGQTPK